jgi:putative cardiolipin synthase
MGRPKVLRIPVRQIAVCALAIGALAVPGCASLPSLEGRAVTTALTDTSATTLGHSLAPQLAAHPGKSGIYPLEVPRDAFAARGLLAGIAERSIDVQYYIWRGDHTGVLLFEALWKAAERGVRVRLLLDDINTSGLDDALAALDAHENIEVRLYNPFTNRSARVFNYIGDFGRVNRRMHNKSFTVDSQATIVGGRNVGDEYFGAGEDVAFADLDVVAIGPIVSEVSSSFDRYWNSDSAYPVAALVRKPEPGGAQRLQEMFAATRADPESAAYLKSLANTELITALKEKSLHYEWTDARLVCDDPAKTLDKENRTDLLLLPQMLEAVGAPTSEFDLISPYFVPGEAGTTSLQELARKGIKVRVLTNSLESTDVSAVHAGYAKRRKALLESGIELWELKRGQAPEDPEGKGSKGSSSASLHAKTFAVDSERVFVGSFNFDPRSARLNTELGVVFGSPVLGEQLGRAFETQVRQHAYEVRLTDDKRDLVWIERTPSGEKRYDSEPGTSVFRRMSVGFLSILPIEWLL